MERPPPRFTRTYKSLALPDALPSSGAGSVAASRGEGEAGRLRLGHAQKKKAASCLAAFSCERMPAYSLFIAVEALLIVFEIELPSAPIAPMAATAIRAEEHTSELQSLMRISYAVFCLKKKKNTSKNMSVNNKL